MKALLLVALLAVSPGAASASSLELALLVVKSIPSDVYIDAAHRRVAALAIQEYWADFDKKLPRLSPAELKWVEDELTSKEESRLARVSVSKELNLRTLARVVDECKESVVSLIASQNDPALATTEMFRWLKVADCYSLSDDSLSRFVAGAELQKGSDESFGGGVNFMILDKILNVIIASAMADTMGWTLSKD